MRKQLTEEQFCKAVNGLEVRKRTIEIAHGVLVQGEAQASYVKKFNLSRGAVSQAINRVYTRAKLLPQGFEEVTALLPSHRAFIRIKNEESTHRSKSKRGSRKNCNFCSRSL